MRLIRECLFFISLFVFVTKVYSTATSLSVTLQNGNLRFLWFQDPTEGASYVFSAPFSNFANPIVNQWTSSCVPGTQCLMTVSSANLAVGYYVFYVYSWNYVTGTGSWSQSNTFYFPGPTVTATATPAATPFPSKSSSPTPSRSPNPSTGPLSGYVLQTIYQGSTFFNGWNFYSGSDPTHGFVQYANSSQAFNSGLVKAGFPTLIKADNVLVTPQGRPSVRLESQMTWNSGLFVMDLNHMPAGCGTWPAWWMFGPSWPQGGEIDIIEGVNLQSNDLTSLHTTSGCTMSGTDTSVFTGTQITPNCDVNAPGQAQNQGCGTQASGAGTYGASFNQNFGGVYVCELAQSNGSVEGAISTWFFPRNMIPTDLTNKVPKPSNWGKPYAKFPLGSNCQANHFSNLQMVIDLTFCGDWAGSAFPSQCSGSCNDFVMSNPVYFSEAYWSINYINVFITA